MGTGWHAWIGGSECIRAPVLLAVTDRANGNRSLRFDGNARCTGQCRDPSQDVRRNNVSVLETSRTTAQPRRQEVEPIARDGFD